MELKTIIDKEEFFKKLIKSGCKFKKICDLYPAKCKNVKYVGQLKNFKEMEVYQISDKEAEFFKTVFKIFKGSKMKIIK
jgi:hypothetical protein